MKASDGVGLDRQRLTVLHERAADSQFRKISRLIGFCEISAIVRELLGRYEENLGNIKRNGCELGHQWIL
jgi:hypothetical protein